MIELRRRYSDGVQSPSFSRLPKEYQEVEWILMPKGGYISSGVNAKGSTRVYTKFAIHELTPSWLFGSRKGLSEDNFGVLNQTVDNALRVAYGTNSQQQSIPNAITDNNIHIIDLNKGYCYFDGGLISSYSQQDFEGLNILIGAFNNNNVINATTSHYFYEFCIWDNDVMIRNFIPCYRTSDYKPGMYDIVNDVFYINAGEGEFSYGPDVHYNIPPEYQQVEYLESTGEQYIVTNIVLNGWDKISTKLTNVQFNETPRCAFGVRESAVGDIGIRMAIYLGQPIVDWYYSSGTSSELREVSSNSFNIEINKGDILINDESIINSVLNLNFTIPLYLFGLNYNGSPTQYFKGRIHTFFVENKAHLIPCYRKSDNEAGMYDLVSGEFYTNAGTGTFEIGPLVI